MRRMGKRNFDPNGPPMNLRDFLWLVFYFFYAFGLYKIIEFGMDWLAS